jgi:hypothetical protein
LCASTRTSPACVTPAGQISNATADPADGKVEVGGRRVAHWFAARNDAQSMRGLLTERAAPVDLNVLDDLGRSPLHLACQYGDSKLVQLLIENGASGGVLTLDGDSCFHLLARRRPGKDNKQWVAVYKLVMAAGANPTRANKLNEYVLHTAALAGNEALVRAVLACPGVDLTPRRPARPHRAPVRRQRQQLGLRDGDQSSDERSGSSKLEVQINSSYLLFLLCFIFFNFTTKILRIAPSAAPASAPATTMVAMPRVPPTSPQRCATIIDAD